MVISVDQIKALRTAPLHPALTPHKPGEMPSISVVAPAYNEEEVLAEFHRRVTAVLLELGCVYEIVLVNDASRDNTLSLMHALRAQEPHVSVVDLSCNFGKEIALSTGLEHTKGDVVIILDSDLQDPPELIPAMLEEWREGYDIAYSVRTARDDETWLKMTTAKSCYCIIKSVSRVDIPKDTGNFRLMTRRAVNALGCLREEHRFMKGLFSWIGSPSKLSMYRRDARAAGETKWNFWSLWNFALEGITSFTVALLKIGKLPRPVGSGAGPAVCGVGDLEGTDFFRSGARLSIANGGGAALGGHAAYFDWLAGRVCRPSFQLGQPPAWLGAGR